MFKRIFTVFTFAVIGLIISLSLFDISYAALTLEGKLLEQGEKVNSNQPVAITVRIYDEEFGGDLLYEEKQKVLVQAGKYAFTFERGEITVQKRTSGRIAESLWVEVESNAQIMTPRLSLADIGTANDLTGESLSLTKANLRSAGTPTMIIDNNGVTLGTLLNMGTQSINLGGVTRSTWPDSSSGDHTHDFADIEGTASDAQIPAAITRDTELTTGLAAKADTGHTHDDRYYTKASVDTTIAALEARISALESLLTHFSRSNNEVTISGANVHIVNGTGTTYGSVNGLGNLIVGYNEERGSGDVRTGSHNFVVGDHNNYSSSGGLVAGAHNEITGIGVSVSGGYGNTASGRYASVSGGLYNEASGDNASVSGGSDNDAFSDYSAILGGQRNLAGDPAKIDHLWGTHATVSGGGDNEASGPNASVSGGTGNTASWEYASVSGGSNNKASGFAASVSGGGGPNPQDGNTAFGNYSAILGGRANIAGDRDTADRKIGQHATVSGGRHNEASGDYASVSGGGGPDGLDGNTAFGNYSAILGGQGNLAGDRTDHAIGEQTTVSGGWDNTASAHAATVSGGKRNTASAGYSSVSGGESNTASGWQSSVSGGLSREASGTDDWRAGAAFQDY